MTLVAVVLTADGLLVAADSRQKLVQLGVARDDAFKIRLVPSPPRCVLCAVGLDVIYDVDPTEVSGPGHPTAASQIILDFGEIAAAQLERARDGVNHDLLRHVARACVRAMNENPRVDRRQLAAHSGRPLTELVLATAARNERRGRLGIARLWVRTDAPQIRAGDFRCRDIYEQGDPYFFGDLGHVERELPGEYAGCRAAISRSPLPTADAVAAIKALIDAAGQQPESPIGGPTDVVLISSEVTKLSWKGEVA